MFELVIFYRELIIKRKIILLSEGSSACLIAFNQIIDKNNDIDFIDDIVSFIDEIGLRGDSIYYFWKCSCSEDIKILIRTKEHIKIQLEAGDITLEETRKKIENKETFF